MRKAARAAGSFGREFTVGLGDFQRPEKAGLDCMEMAVHSFTHRLMLAGLSPETPDKAMSTAERHAIDIDILSDAGNRIAEQMGLVFELPQALRPIYEKVGIDIAAFNGDDSFKLPVPATYIIGQDGVIVFHFVNADYTQRLEPSDIVSRLAMY